MDLRGTGFSADSGMLSAFDEMEAVGDTGLLMDAAVDGFRSWTGDGFGLIEADCMVDATSMAGFAMAHRGLDRPTQGKG